MVQSFRVRERRQLWVSEGEGTVTRTWKCREPCPEGLDGSCGLLLGLCQHETLGSQGGGRGARGGLWESS